MAISVPLRTPSLAQGFTTNSPDDPLSSGLQSLLEVERTSPASFDAGQLRAAAPVTAEPVSGRVTPQVAVIIPFYNGAAFIERAVRSVFAQSMPAAEVIVVNDGSRAQEREALGELAARYPFRILDKENGGQGSARNAGVAATTSPFLCFLDQDDFFLPEHIETLVRAIPPRAGHFGFVYGDLYEADGEGNIVHTDVLQAHSTHPKRSIFDLLSDDMFVLPSASLISRAAFEAVGGFDPQFMGYEDDDLFMRIFRKGYSNHFTDASVTVWCIHTTSTSFSITMARSRFKYFKKLLAMFPDEHARGRYYLRECLIPRFHEQFVNDAIDGIKRDGPYRAEAWTRFNDYADIVLSNPYVGRKRKLRIWLTVKMLRHSSPRMVRCVGAVTRLPVVRLLRRIYKR